MATVYLIDHCAVGSFNLTSMSSKDYKSTLKEMLLNLEISDRTSTGSSAQEQRIREEIQKVWNKRNIKCYWILRQDISPKVSLDNREADTQYIFLIQPRKDGLMTPFGRIIEAGYGTKAKELEWPRDTETLQRKHPFFLADGDVHLKLDQGMWEKSSLEVMNHLAHLCCVDPESVGSWEGSSWQCTVWTLVNGSELPGHQENAGILALQERSVTRRSDTFVLYSTLTEWMKVDSYKRQAEELGTLDDLLQYIEGAPAQEERRMHKSKGQRKSKVPSIAEGCQGGKERTKTKKQQTRKDRQGKDGSSKTPSERRWNLVDSPRSEGSRCSSRVDAWDQYWLNHTSRKEDGARGQRAGQGEPAALVKNEQAISRAGDKVLRQAGNRYLALACIDDGDLEQAAHLQDVTEKKEEIDDSVDCQGAQQEVASAPRRNSSSEVPSEALPKVPSFGAGQLSASGSRDSRFHDDTSESEEEIADSVDCQGVEQDVTLALKGNSSSKVPSEALRKVPSFGAGQLSASGSGDFGEDRDSRFHDDTSESDCDSFIQSTTDRLSGSRARSSTPDVDREGDREACCGSEKDTSISAAGAALAAAVAELEASAAAAASNYAALVCTAASCVRAIAELAKDASEAAAEAQAAVAKALAEAAKALDVEGNCS
eukprot:jgi/Botrbrau1/14460/Bobra.0014s0102.2